MGAPVSSTSLDNNAVLKSSFSLPLLGRKRPVLRAKLACLFCRRRKIQCRPLPGDNLSNTCQLVFFFLQGSAGISGADHHYCAGNVRSGAESASTRR